jgi:hypothetical protein
MKDQNMETLIPGEIYEIKFRKQWQIAVFLGYENDRASGVDWRFSLWQGPNGRLRIPASSMFLAWREIPEK